MVRLGIGIGELSLRQAPSAEIYGIAWDATSTDPSCERTDAAVGKIAQVGVDEQAVQNDFDNLPIWGEMKKVTDASGNVFIRIPKFYIKKTRTETICTDQVSKHKHPGFYLPWCFWDFTNDRELPYVDYGAHLGYLSSGKLHSLPNQHPDIARNFDQYRSDAESNGVGYQQLDIHVYDALIVLMTIEFATHDMQSIMPGFTNGPYSDDHIATVTEDNVNHVVIDADYADEFVVGQSVGIGISRGGRQILHGRTITNITSHDENNKAIEFDGTPVNIIAGYFVYSTAWKTGFSDNIEASSGCIIANSNKYPCMYRGIESPYGDIWQWVDGINVDDNQAWICADANEYQNNLFTDPYVQLSYINADTNGYITARGFDTDNPAAEFPILATDTYMQSRWRDFYYQTQGQFVGRVGGSWLNESDAGPFSWVLPPTGGHPAITIGGRLIKKAIS